MALPKSVCIPVLSLKYVLPEGACEAAWDKALEYIKRHLKDNPEKHSLHLQSEKFADEAKNIFAEPDVPWEITRLALSDEDRLMLCKSVWKAVLDAQKQARKRARTEEEHGLPNPYRGVRIKKLKRIHCQLEGMPETRTGILLESIIQERPQGGIRSRDLSYSLFSSLVANRYGPPTASADPVRIYYKSPENESIKVYIRDDHSLHSAIEDLVAYGKDTLLFEVQTGSWMLTDRGIESCTGHANVRRPNNAMIDDRNVFTARFDSLNINEDEDYSSENSDNEDDSTDQIDAEFSDDDYSSELDAGIESEHDTNVENGPDTYFYNEPETYFDNEHETDFDCEADTSSSNEHGTYFYNEPEPYFHYDAEAYFDNEPETYNESEAYFENEADTYYDDGPDAYYESEYQY
ncbi:uncharacterized protein TRUGW13939_01605 [Talaromyces rugulosus]|uniref:Uncharacterized protein n=1 Tax=Talaromyces rugulosus TaxID=121627 RepID=A0A7H8QKV4_TALRU|nr:uncharacterized protein TRUGW13939_01605 [Talaromyces rugulosus]QKX54518.1 hypothetical protein TRUGW13939_01605 [Talaromyces rugulosus]